MTKTDQYFKLMLDQNQKLFQFFFEVSEKYEKNPQHYHEIFNAIGLDVQDTVRRYENRLCSGTENGGFGKFSTKLSEKFQSRVLKEFPQYNHIGE